jgi:hypothetical protein
MWFNPKLLFFKLEPILGSLDNYSNNSSLFMDFIFEYFIYQGSFSKNISKLKIPKLKTSDF